MPEKTRCACIGEQIVRRPIDLVDDLRAAALDGEPDLEGEAGIAVRHLLADRREVGGHAVAEPFVAGPFAAEALDLLARLGALEGLPHRLQGVAAAIGPAVGLARAAAARHHLGVLAGGGPPGGPLGFADQPGEDVADLAGGERPVVALEHGAQELGGRSALREAGLSSLRRSTCSVASGLSSFGAALKPTVRPRILSKSTLKLSSPRLASTTRPTPLPSMATTVPTSKASRLSRRSTFSQVLGMSVGARWSPTAS